MPDILARLLAARGLQPDEAAHFLEPTLRALMPDPSTLAGMDEAAARLAAAVQQGETVGIFGDYDVDGACSAAIVTLLLRRLGCRVLTHIPDRTLEGYGPNTQALDEMAAQGATLLVCVDCGTAAADIFAALARRTDIVVLDHHVPQGALPAIAALVNPNQAACASGLGHLCAGGLAFMAAIATQRTLRRAGFFATRPEPDLRDLLDLVALATVCDVMPLTGLNRAFVAGGLKILARRDRPGLAALLEVAGVTATPTAMNLGWALGPRINAGGRIGTPDLGLSLLLADSAEEARLAAARLDSINRTRQTVEADILDAALAQAQTQLAEGHAALLVSGETWHPGVVGIVAGRIKERFNRPALVASLNDGHAKGSGRSVPGLDLGGAVIAARSHGLLESGGGHPMAAGFTCTQANLEPFHAFLDTLLAAARTLPSAADLTVEATLSVAGCTLELAESLARLAPFGPGNEEPIIVLPRTRIARTDRIGKDGTTLRLFLEDTSGARLKSVLFRAAGTPLGTALEDPTRGLFHLAGHLRAETWNGRTTASFICLDAAPA